MSTAHDPSRTSHYISDTYYADLVAAFGDWQRDEHIVSDPAIRAAAEAVVLREARLLDCHAYRDWLTLFAPECAYWVPGRPDGGDPRREVAVAFFDRRRLEDHVHRLSTGVAWSQVPRSRTVHAVSNIEVFRAGADAPLMVRSNLMLSEFRAGEGRLISGWCAHRLGQTGGNWRILVKQVNLLECDQNLRNPSIVF